MLYHHCPVPVQILSIPQSTKESQTLVKMSRGVDQFLSTYFRLATFVAVSLNWELIVLPDFVAIQFIDPWIDLEKDVLNACGESPRNGLGK
jgi:hypothetical protein